VAGAAGEVVTEEEEEGNVVVQNAGHVTTIRTPPRAELKRASKPIATLMTSNVQVTSTSRRDPHSPSGREFAGRRYSEHASKHSTSED
jgi:hypothetical protein